MSGSRKAGSELLIYDRLFSPSRKASWRGGWLKVPEDWSPEDATAERPMESRWRWGNQAHLLLFRVALLAEARRDVCATIASCETKVTLSPGLLCILLRGVEPSPGGKRSPDQQWARV